MIPDHWTFPQFARPIHEPVLRPDPKPAFKCPFAEEEVRWRCGGAFRPAAAIHEGKVHLIFRAEDGFGDGLGRYTSRLGLAVSEDGLKFKAQPKPVLAPDKDAFADYEWPGGCEDPRLVRAPDGRFVLTYTAWDRRSARLSVATSTDLVHWEKHGPAFVHADGGRWIDMWSKAGSIVCEATDDGLVAVRLQDRYWMYWGEGSINVAWSTDLLNWNPLGDGEGRLVQALHPRMCMFDSELIEPGPPAVLTPQGIVLIFNAKNDGNMGDPSLRGGAYTVAQALFASDQPDRLLDRTNWPFLKPETDYEHTGQYEPGMVFAEGLIPFGDKWLLYFGCADSVVGVAEAPRNRRG